MQWQEIRTHYPNQSLLVEALEGRTDGRARLFDDLAVIDTFADSESALVRYREFHRTAPARELLVAHTSRENLDVTVGQWLGVRTLIFGTKASSSNRPSLNGPKYGSQVSRSARDRRGGRRSSSRADAV